MLQIKNRCLVLNVVFCYTRKTKVESLGLVDNDDSCVTLLDSPKKRTTGKVAPLKLHEKDEGNKMEKNARSRRVPEWSPTSVLTPLNVA